jgi:tRNA-Thr(GGU) m(6)t(6)A37 methyltransferase TsaA
MAVNDNIPAISMRTIGVIHSPFTDKSQTPIQSSRSQARGVVEVFPEYAEGLQDLEGFSHIFLLYIFHQSSGYNLLTKPFLDDQLHGLFATRYPYRPNPVGFSLVQLIKRKENILEIQGVDMLDGTPLLDIKPYIPEFDIRLETRNGWYDSRIKGNAAGK